MQLAPKALYCLAQALEGKTRKNNTSTIRQRSYENKTPSTFAILSHEMQELKKLFNRMENNNF